jgi:hypothetical protein
LNLRALSCNPPEEKNMPPIDKPIQQRRGYREGDKADELQRDL